jgi:hypothetical protein
MLAVDAKNAGKNAAKSETKHKKEYINVKPGKGIRYVVPQILNEAGKIHFTLRVEKPCGSSTLFVNAGGKELLKKKLPWTNPANMIGFDVDVSDEIIKSNDTLEVVLDG